MSEFKIVRSHLGPAVALRLEGPLSANSSAAMIERLDQLVNQTPVVVDMRAVGDLDPLAVVSLSKYMARASQNRRALALLSEPGSRVGEALAREPSVHRIPVVRATAGTVERIVGLTLYHGGRKGAGSDSLR